MAVLADAEEDEISGIFLQKLGVFLALLFRVLLLAQQEIQLLELHAVEDRSAQEATEAGGLGLVDADVLVLMEAADLGPVDVVFQQVFQQLVLGGSGGKDDVCLAAAGDDVVDALCCVLCRSRAHFLTGIIDINRQIFNLFGNHVFSLLIDFSWNRGRRRRPPDFPAFPCRCRT